MLFLQHRILSSLIFFGVCTSLFACNSSHNPSQPTDKITVDKATLVKAKRYIALAPSHCEWIYEFKAEASLFGRSEHCDHPKQVEKVPSVGQLFPPKLERILQLAPSDVLMIDGHLELKGKLQSLGVKVHQIQPKSLADILRQSQEIGQILERPKQAKKWLKTSQNKLKQIQVIKEKPRVLIEIWFSPLTIAGSSSYMGDLLNQAGGQTLVNNGQWPTVSLESVIHFNPEVLFISTLALYKQLTSPEPPQAWRTVDAVKTGKVYLLEGRLARPGPRIIDELLWLHQKLN